MRIFSPPKPFRHFYPKDLIWSFPPENKRLFLTFDDGPHPEITLAVMEALKAYDARATFFCLGKNALAYPELISLLKEQEHEVGNHTFNHLNGWATATEYYYQDYLKAQKVLGQGLFRPPYGRITHAQLARIMPLERIVMWSLLSYDFDPSFSEKAILNALTTRISDGAIIVFHDSEKAAPRCLKILPQLLDNYKQLGYEFCAIKNLDIPAERT